MLRLSRRFGSWLLIVTCSLSVSPPAASAQSTEDLQLRIIAEKRKAEALVIQILKDYKPGSAEYKEAKSRYEDARRVYNAYVEVLLVAVERGKRPEFDDIARQAESTAKKFQDYVNDKTAARNIITVLSAAAALIEVGLKLWEKYDGYQVKQREAHAKALRPILTWRDWDDIRTMPLAS